MSPAFELRPEQPGDERAIYDLVAQAFAPMPFADGDEQDLVDRLRERGELVHPLVAVDAQGKIIGYIAFSGVTIDHLDRGWFQMAPVAVTPSLQRKGIGSALIETGIGKLREDGAGGVGVVGDPGYYERFGFRKVAGLQPLGELDAQYFRAMVLSGELPQGIVRYASAFG